ncbi:hypothetical protein [Helicobacter canis]|uniref:hypothetical protein n=1 Tax=Helicobacter canis TaxID=29419 RepID=UPI0029431A7D|nr:hypothetical protein [Helicobacter canis]
MGDRIVALRARARAHTWSYVTAGRAKQSTILAPKPTPKPSKAESVLELGH